MASFVGTGSSSKNRKCTGKKHTSGRRKEPCYIYPEAPTIARYPSLSCTPGARTLGPVCPGTTPRGRRPQWWPQRGPLLLWGPLLWGIRSAPRWLAEPGEPCAKSPRRPESKRVSWDRFACLHLPVREETPSSVWANALSFLPRQLSLPSRAGRESVVPGRPAPGWSRTPGAVLVTAFPCTTSSPWRS